MSLKVEAFCSEQAFTQLCEEWNPLVESNPHHHIFMTWEWQSNWWAAYHPGDLWIITLRDENQQLVGLFPWFVHQTAKGRMVRWVGCVEVTDYLEAIIRPGYEEQVVEALVNYVQQEKVKYDLIDLCNIPEDAPILKVLPPTLEQHGYQVVIKQQEVCPIIRLPETWDAHLEKNMDKKNRHEIRRKLRRIAAPDHQVTWDFASQTEHLEETMARFLKLMRASSPDKAKFLEDPENVDFFHRIVPAVAAKGWLAMSFLQIDGQDAAAYFSFDYNNKILLYNSGHNPDLFAELSPGIVLLAFIIQDAITKKREVFDFLRGDEEYKYRMGGTDTAVMMFSAVPA